MTMSEKEKKNTKQLQGNFGKKKFKQMLATSVVHFVINCQLLVINCRNSVKHFIHTFMYPYINVYTIYIYRYVSVHVFV